MDPHPLILGGRYRHTPSVIPVVNPYSQVTFAEVCAAGPNEAEEAIQQAEEGARLMAALPAYKRSATLSRLAGLMEEEADLLTDIIVREGGKVRKLAETEVSRAITTIRISAEEAVRIHDQTIPMDGYPAGEGRIALILRVPVGIVLAITPFNLPLNQICHKAGPAYAAGNACIIKPASATPLTGLKFGELMLRAGFPKEAVNVIPCRPDVAERMVTDRRIACLSFTGSPSVGWYLRSITPARHVTLELGGNAGVIVHEDADQTLAASRIIEGAYAHAGQVCISVQRVFVQRSIADLFIHELVSRCNALVTGDPEEPGTDVGPMIHPEKAIEAHRKIEEAVAHGARILCGGRLSGHLLVPTILADTTPDMAVRCEELFAPVLTVTVYDTFDEAVTMLNDSRYGLQAGIFTKDLGRAISAAQMIQCGAVLINDIPTFRMDSMPYGGVKESGIGREGPYFAIREMTEERLIIIRP
jgi:acyl-CoA reductase-like NAD-dependent aldehyde dehydrogenase